MVVFKILLTLDWIPAEPYLLRVRRRVCSSESALSAPGGAPEGALRHQSVHLQNLWQRAQDVRRIQRAHEGSHQDEVGCNRFCCLSSLHYSRNIFFFFIHKIQTKTLKYPCCLFSQTRFQGLYEQNMSKCWLQWHQILWWWMFIHHVRSILHTFFYCFDHFL